MAASQERKQSFADALSSPAKIDKDIKPPLTPPLSDPLTSGTVSPMASSKNSSSFLTVMGAESEWKTIGSPRRSSVVSGNGGTPSNHSGDEYEAQKIFRARTASTPNAIFHENSRANDFDRDVNEMVGSNSKWGNSLGMEWRNGASIWNGESPSLVPGAAFRNRTSSFSDEKLFRNHVDTEPLKDDDEKYSPYLAPKIGRNRSQSSSAIFGIPSISISDSPRGSYNDLNKIWSNGVDSQVEPLRDSSSIHRRSSTQPNQMWESDVMNPEEMEPYEAHRRFTHAASSLYNDAYAQHLMSKPSGAGEPDEYPGMDMRRRHSLAGPLYAPGSSTRYLTETLENINLNDGNDVPPTYEDINDYFENTEHRTKAWVEAGKNLQMQSFSQTWPLCVVEFKAGRHDFFYVSDPSLVVKKGDLCIVEADRGKDLGKVIHDNIQNIQQLQLYQANHIDLLAESQFGKDVHPKRIYRLALPNEISLLVSKSQDEAKAVSISQSKIRQKQLPMEVVDAEYQWDRRKLTLYFVADRRIDFRELVRDLFKLYKTRIWMCAVNPLKQLPHQPQPM